MARLSGFGRKARLRIGAQVVLAAALALVGAVLAIDLADWHYLRVDLSASRRNTLDETVLDILDRLPEPVTVDVFFRELRPPYQTVSREVQARMLELLFVADNARREALNLRVHDPDRLEQVQARQKELGVEGVNLLVYSCGGRKAVQELFGEIAVIDWGSPTRDGLRYLAEQGLPDVVDVRRWNPERFQPAALSVFRGEEAFAQGLLKVASGESLRVYFSKGSGEPDPEGASSTDLALLARALEQDGFDVQVWEPSDGGPVPEDCAVLGLLGATQPLPPGTLERVREWVAAGGALIGAPAFDEVERGGTGGIVELLSSYGMIPEPGIVCEAYVDQAGRSVEGTPYCSQILVGESGLSASHPLTEPLRRRGRRVQFVQTQAFRRGGLEAGVLLDLVTSSNESWRDLPLLDGRYDYALDPRSEERERQRLCMLAEFSSGAPFEDGTMKKGRVLGVASAGFFSDGLFPVNKDFLLNAFNWMASREYRVRVSPLERGESRLDLARSTALPVLSYVLYLGLPGLCVGIGLLVAWKRRS